MSHRFLVLILFIFPFISQAQIDQKMLDSLRESIDSSAAMHEQWQDSFAKVQDSVYQQAISKTVRTEKTSEELRKKEVERQRIMQGIVIALLALIAVLLMLRHRKKKST